MKIWMRVTLDRYQLPMAVADSAAELAKMCDTTTNVIYSELSRYRHGKTLNCSWRCVNI